MHLKYYDENRSVYLTSTGHHGENVNAHAQQITQVAYMRAL